MSGQAQPPRPPLVSVKRAGKDRIIVSISEGNRSLILTQMELNTMMEVLPLFVVE